MIAVKNLQNMSNLLTQEEVLRAIAELYIGMTTSAQVKTLLKGIITTSEKNTADMLAYLKTHQQ